MSAGHAHAKPNLRHPQELRKLRADPSFVRMWARPYRVVVDKQIPDSAGYGILGDVYYVDADLFQAIKAGRVVVKGLTPEDIIECLLEHERVEKCLLDADNDLTSYPECHEFATLAEHEKVRAKGGSPVEYEAALRPFIRSNQTKPLTNVPHDLSCAPLIDDPDAQDRRTLKVLRGLGIPDAFKIAKKSVGYSRSTGADRCDGCGHWMGGAAAELAPCETVDGGVRANWWCQRWEKGDGEAQQGASGLQGGGSQDRQEVGDQGPGGGAGGDQQEGQPGGEEGQPAAQPGERVA